jgi:hypothetical protein
VGLRPPLSLLALLEAIAVAVHRIPPVWAALPVSAGITDASMFD